MPRLMRKTSFGALFLAIAFYFAASATSSAEDPALIELGKQVFTEAEPPCATCHSLADAGAAGEIGPDLDELRLPEERVRAAVADGVGVMPAYGGKLSEEEIAAVSAYIAAAAGQSD